MVSGEWSVVSSECAGPGTGLLYSVRSQSVQMESHRSIRNRLPATSYGYHGTASHARAAPPHPDNGFEHAGVVPNNVLLGRAHFLQFL